MCRIINAMKKLFGLLCLFLFAGPLAAHEIDSLYDVFLISKGENAVRLANEIVILSGDTARFTAGASVDEMNEFLLMKLVFWHYDRAEMAEVVNYSNKAIERYREQDDLFNLAGCYNMLGVTYQRMGHFEEAINNYHQSNKLMNRLNELDANPFYEISIRYTTNNMAAIYSSMGEFDMAEKLYIDCINRLGQYESDNDYLDMATYLQNLSGVYLSQTKYLDGRKAIEKIEQAVELSEQALDYSLQYGEKANKIPQRRLAVAKAYFASGRHDEAFVMLDEALQTVLANGDHYMMAEFELTYGQFLLDMEQYKNAELHFQNAINISKEGGFDDCLINAYKGASDASRHFDAHKALDYYEKTTALKDSIFNDNQQTLIRDYQVKYDLAEKEHQIAIHEKNNKIHAAKTSILTVFLILFAIIMFILSRMIRIRKKQNETLARLNDTQNRILSVASHDVKNSVLAQNMVLKLANEHFDNMDRNELKEKLASLKTNSDELKDKLYNILHWIYGELGKESNPSEVFNLLNAIEVAIKPHADELKLKGLEVVCEVAPSLQCFDKLNVFNIVFQNLFTNAIKFSKEGGKITVRAVEDGQQVWVEVADNGVGISPKRLQELMHDTVKSTEGTHGEHGTGIGLFVSRHLMVRKGGQLLIDSVEGQGTSIKFNMTKN